MAHLSPEFGEEFHVATDDEVLAVDFWSYLNARQARLPLGDVATPLWDLLEELERELEPLLDERASLGHRDFMAAAALLWSAEAGPPALRREVRREAGAMLSGALASTAIKAGPGEDAAPATQGRNHAQQG
jgi:hypothetical protein